MNNSLGKFVSMVLVLILGVLIGHFSVGIKSIDQGAQAINSSPQTQNYATPSVCNRETAPFIKVLDPNGGSVYNVNASYNVTIQSCNMPPTCTMGVHLIPLDPQIQMQTFPTNTFYLIPGIHTYTPVYVSKYNFMDKYRIKALAWSPSNNSNCTGTSGDIDYSDNTFLYNTPPVAPEVNTQPVVAVGKFKATIQLDFKSNDTPTSTWMTYGISQSNLNLSTNVDVNTLKDSGPFGLTKTFNLAGLTPNTTYYFRGVGQNAYGKTTGVLMKFTTLP